MWAHVKGYGQAKSYEMHKRQTKTANSINEQGIVHYQNAQYPEAIVCFTKAINFNLNNENFFFNRASAYVKVNQEEKGLADILKALEINPQHKRAIQLKLELEDKWIEVKYPDNAIPLKPLRRR